MRERKTMKMEMVRKRSGRKVPFDEQKIKIAIDGANEDLGEDADGYLTMSQVDSLVDEVTRRIKDQDRLVGVEEIQDIVVQTLKDEGYLDIAKAYTVYRKEREERRIYETELLKKFREKLDGSNIENQNANLDEHSFSGRMNEAARVMFKDDALHRMSRQARENHENNMIYTHDLDSWSSGQHNCLSIPFDDILRNGFSTRQADVRSPRSINTALQLVAVVMQLQSLQQFGGVSATHIDWTMVPYVRFSLLKHLVSVTAYDNDCSEDEAKATIYGEVLKARGIEYGDAESAKEAIVDMAYDMKFDLIGTLEKLYADQEISQKHFYKKALAHAIGLTTSDVEQGSEALIHNLNTLQSRSGQQLPFSSINYGTCTLPEGRMITSALLDASLDGVGPLHKTPIFPCGIFQYMKGVNDKPGTPNYDLFRKALLSTSLRLYPNYANVNWSGNAGYDPEDPKTYFSTMGCRTTNGIDINADEGQHPQTKDGRGNLAPATIILPTLAMEANRDVEKFMELLDQKIHEARDQLIERYEWMCMQGAESASFMYNNHTMLGYKPEEGIRSALRHGTLVIGQLGLAETLQLLIGCDHTTDEGMELAKRIEQLFKDRCAQFKQEEHLNFGVYYTPAENLCYTAMKKFRKTYGVIPNVSDREYFTNSMHVPVWHDLTPFEKIDIESQLTGYSNAGCITYVELDSTTSHNLDALEELVTYAMDHDIPYFACNLPCDSCQDCGYSGEINDRCPQCGSDNIQRLRRVTGYLTNDYKTAFNYGKQCEVEDRVKHNGRVDACDITE